MKITNSNPIKFVEAKQGKAFPGITRINIYRGEGYHREIFDLPYETLCGTVRILRRIARSTAYCIADNVVSITFFLH